MTRKWPSLLAGLTLLASVASAQPKAPGPSEQRFWVGAHTAIVWEGQNAESAVSGASLREGADYRYIDLSWRFLEPQPGEYDSKHLTQIDGFLAAADERAVPVLLALHHGYMPEWAPWSNFFTDEIQERFRGT